MPLTGGMNGDHAERGNIMTKTLHYHAYDAGAYEGETEHRIMCSFYSLVDGEYRPGQSQLVLASEWPTYRSLIERNGWISRKGGSGMNTTIPNIYLTEARTVTVRTCEATASITVAIDGDALIMTILGPDAATPELVIEKTGEIL